MSDKTVRGKTWIYFGGKNFRTIIYKIVGDYLKEYDYLDINMKIKYALGGMMKIVNIFFILWVK